MEKHDWKHKTQTEHRDWMTGASDWDEIKEGIKSVPNGAIIAKHYMLARKYAYYGHG